MTTKKPSTVTSATGAYSYKSGVSSNSFNYIDNTFPNLLDKTGDNATNGGGISGRIDLLAGSSLLLVNGASITLNGGDLVFNNTSGINFNNSSTVVFGDTSSILMGSSTSLITSGTLNIASGGTLGINGGATMHVKSGATEYVDSGGNLEVSSGGALKIDAGANLNVASGGNINIASGGYLTATNATTTFNGNLVILTGGVTVDTSGTGNFVTVGSGNTLTVAGTQRNASFPQFITPISRQTAMDINMGAAQFGTWLKQSSGVQNTASGPFSPGQSTLIIPLDRLHNGSTLASIFIAFIVGTPHSAVPANLPVFSVYRYGGLGGSGPVTYQYLNSTAIQSPTNPGSGSAWYASGGVQYFQYVTNQNNVIDNTQYCYAMSVSDESGSNSLGGNFYLMVFAENQVINDLSWNI